MHVPLWVWALTVLGLLVLLAVDFLVIDRRPREIPVKEAAGWVAATVAAAAVFGVGLGLVADASHAGQFFAGWMTEYSLSVDNLFVFVVIMARFAVPRAAQHRALLLGVLLALVLRGAFIAAGAAVLDSFTWAFYIFGAFLVFTAARLARSGVGGHDAAPDEAEAEADTGGDTGTDANAAKENVLIRALRRRLPMTEDYDGTRLFTRRSGRRLATPLFIAVVVIGTTDVMFALDSIPAIFALTREPYIVFTANMFALLGLRQLYFLVGGALRRLVHLSAGLSVILAFIGAKMIFEALHGSSIHHVGPVPVPHIDTVLSLIVIVGVLAATTATSLVATRRSRVGAA
jgi:tellurite resistance protein TerC